MKHRYISFVLLLLSSFANGQIATISGRVHTDRGTPVSHITIRVAGTAIRCISDKQGRFELKDVPYGNRQLLLTSLEIEPLERNFLVNEPRHALDLVVHRRKNESIDEVLIQEQNEKQKIETSGFAAVVIETQQAALRNLTTNELLDRAVGVRIRQNGGVGSPVTYNLNGMSGSTVGIFIDGIDASTYGSSFNLNNIPPALIERIEVYKGVLPAHLSGNYVGGAIHVILKKNVSKNNVTVATSYGSFNTYQADLGVNYRDPASGFTFRGSGFLTHSDNSYETWGESTTYVDYMGRVTRPFRAKRFNNVYHSNAGRFEAGFTDVPWADAVLIGFNTSKSYAEIPHGISMSTPYVGRFQEGKAHVWSLNYQKNNLLIDGLALSLNAAAANRNTYLEDTVTYHYNWDHTLREIIDDGERRPIRKIYIDEFGQQQYMAQQGRPTMTNVDRQLINTRTHLAYYIRTGHRLTLNHAFRQTDRQDEDLLRPSMRDLMSTSQQIQNVLVLNYEGASWENRLRTNAQLKYTADRNNQHLVDFVHHNGERKIERRDTSMYTDNIGYAIALAFRVAPKIYGVGSQETSFVSPTEIQLFGEPEQNILANTDLRPEKNINLNLGVRTESFHRGRHRISAYVSAFWRNGYDKIMTETLDGDTIQNIDHATLDVTRYVNIGRTQARGFEAELNYAFAEKLYATVNFSRFNNLYKTRYDDLGNPSPYYNQQVVNEPFFNVNTTARYRLEHIGQRGSILDIHYHLGYVHAYNIAWGNPSWGWTPKQFQHDVGVSYCFPSRKLVVSLDLRNMLNAELYDNFKKQKPGRGVYLKLNYTIRSFYN